MVRVLLALIALLGLMWFFSQLGRLTGAERTQFLKRAAIYGVVGLVLLMVLTGRAPAIFALIGAVIPWMRRAALLRSMAGALSGMGIRIPGLDRVAGLADAFRPGAMESRFLRLSRDAGSGRITGAVMDGRFSGRRLDEMSLKDLFTLMNEIKASDAESEPLLVSYLDEAFTGWREQYQSGAGNTEAMSRAEALEVLGLDADAGESEIIDAHRKLMARVHPDRGGVDWMAVKLNQARDVLLNKSA